MVALFVEMLNFLKKKKTMHLNCVLSKKLIIEQPHAYIRSLVII